jgi:hypothetical protein
MLVHRNYQVAQFPPNSTDLPIFKPLSAGGYGVDKSNYFWGLGDPTTTYGCFKPSP